MRESPKILRRRRGREMAAGCLRTSVVQRDRTARVISNVVELTRLPSRTQRTRAVPGFSTTTLPASRTARPWRPNPRTTLAYSTSRDGHVRLTVHGVAGRRVTTLVDGYQAAGRHTVAWDGRDAMSTPVRSGICFVRLDGGQEVQTWKVVVSR